VLPENSLTEHTGSLTWPLRSAILTSQPGTGTW